MIRRYSATLAILGIVQVSFGQGWNLEKDFETASNPNGAWSYGSTYILGGFTAFTNTSNVPNEYPNAASGWSKQSFALPYVAQNVSGATTFGGWHPGDILMHSWAHDMPVSRWTAPSTIRSTVSLTASFRRIEGPPNVSDWWILDNGATLSSGQLFIIDQQATFSQSLTVHAGDVIDFVVGYEDRGSGANATGLNVNAQFQATKTVPGPASMLGFGIPALGRLLKRKKK